jgi:monofunctional biosynthetic peptidoglycan transglycosylase
LAGTNARKHRTSLGARLRRWTLRLVLAAVLGSAGLVGLLRWVDPPYSAVMLQRLAVEGAPQRQTWVDLEDVDPHMALAVVAAEDQRFPVHWGFDTVEILNAVERHLDGGGLRGASTISQQVARNLFLWQGRSFLRKGLEAWFTGLIELLWPKRRILEMYLNFAEMGERTFGVGAASERLFGLTPGRLGRQRAALLAAVLPNPVQLRADAPSAYVRERRDWILGQMRNLGGTAYLDALVKGR